MHHALAKDLERCTETATVSTNQNTIHDRKSVSKTKRGLMELDANVKGQENGTQD